MPHGLYHLARQHGVVERFRRGGEGVRGRTRAVAVVAEQQPDFVAVSLDLPSALAHSLPGLLELLLRQRQPRPRVQQGKTLQGAQGQRAPAAADLQDIVSRSQPRRVEQRVEFGQLSFFQAPSRRV